MHMTPISSQEDLIRRASSLPLADGLRLAKLWKDGHQDVVIHEVETRVPHPIIRPSKTVH
jgi:hypothetical protein